MSSTNWSVLYSTKLANYVGQNYKMARISKYTNDEDVSFVYVDIRNYNAKHNATKNGVCLKPEEFIWFIKLAKEKKRSGKLEKNNRQLIIKKFGSSGNLLTLVTYAKTTTFGLEGYELNALLKKSGKIIDKLKSAVKPIRSSEERVRKNNEDDNISQSMDETDNISDQDTNEDCLDSE